MPKTSMMIGALLVVIGLGGYVIGLSGERASLTALIPAGFGIVLFLLGYFASANEGLRKHLMHAAAAVALLGFLATGGRLLSQMRNFAITPANLSALATAVLCLVFVILAVRSFVEARRARTA